MTGQRRSGCAARLMYRDKHQCVTSWRIVTTPAGETYELCSAACLVSYAIYGALPADLEPRHSAPDSEAA